MSYQSICRYCSCLHSLNGTYLLLSLTYKWFPLLGMFSLSLYPYPLTYYILWLTLPQPSKLRPELLFSEQPTQMSLCMVHAPRAAILPSILTFITQYSRSFPAPVKKGLYLGHFYILAVYILCAPGWTGGWRSLRRCDLVTGNLPCPFGHNHNCVKSAWTYNHSIMFSDPSLVYINFFWFPVPSPPHPDWYPLSLLLSASLSSRHLKLRITLWVWSSEHKDTLFILLFLC